MDIHDDIRIYKMKLKSAKIVNFKRFTNLNIGPIPESVKLVVLVGPNGSGKTSLFEAFNFWRILKGYNNLSHRDYFEKKIESILGSNDWQHNSVNLEFHNNPPLNQNEIKKIFYFRTAYRNEPDFTINSIQKQGDPLSTIRLHTLMSNDLTVSENYQRLVSKTIHGIYDESNDSKHVKDFRNEIVGKIKASLSNVFEDLSLASIGNPTENGAFFFTKGDSKDFHYKNLSAGEKSVFDIILDIIVKNEYYLDSILCIDEPEAHIHTNLQGLLLREIYNITSNSSQLWISTHSIGMLKEAENIEKEFPNSVAFLDFSGRDFDLEENISPSSVGKALWNKFFDLAFADFSKLIAPEKIIFCEGTNKGRAYKNFDAQIYGIIFQESYPSTAFISIGSCSEIENAESNHLNVIGKILSNTSIVKFIDRDDRSTFQIEELQNKNIKVSSRRNIECYILDDEIIKKLCLEKVRADITSGKIKKEDETSNVERLQEECLAAKKDSIRSSIERGNPFDDIKSASGEIYTKIKNILNLTQCGNNKCAFLRDTMARLITQETNIYKELEREIMK